MEYKRSSHVEEEEEEEEEEEDEEEEEEDEEEARGHRYTTAAAAPQHQQVHAQALGLGSHSALMDAAAFSRPLLPPNSSLVTQPAPPPPGFMPPQLHPRRAERERERERERPVGAPPPPQPRRHHEGARNGVLGGGGNVAPPPASTLAGAMVAVDTAPPAVAQWRYRECLRNHAARLGAHVLDGCCEFMPSAADGPGAMACAACGCHRSFHRREAVPGGVAVAAVPPSPTTPAVANSSRVMPLLLAPPHMQTPRPHVPPVSPSSAPAALTESSSEELRGTAPPHPPAATLPPHAQQQVGVVGGGSASAPPAPSKKRFRTKFTAEQKERMREFAHRLGWRIHKPDSDAVDAFCAQVGVSRRVLKVWMHNNKHLAKIPPSPPPSQPAPPHHHEHHPPPHHIHHHHPPPPPQQQQHDA